MPANIPTFDATDLVDVEALPRKVRSTEPVKSPYQPLIQRSLDEGGTSNGRKSGEGKPKALPGLHSLVPEGDSKTSAFTAITRELGRAARQMGLTVKTRKIVDKTDANKVTIVYQTFQSGADEAKSDANGSANGSAAPAAKPVAAPAAAPAAKPQPARAGAR